MAVDTERVDMAAAQQLLDELSDQLDRLNGADLDAHVPNNKELMRQKAQLRTDLQYAAHIADLIRVEIMSQYHRFKGTENVPTVDAGVLDP